MKFEKAAQEAIGLHANLKELESASSVKVLNTFRHDEPFKSQDRRRLRNREDTPHTYRTQQTIRTKLTTIDKGIFGAQFSSGIKHPEKFSNDGKPTLEEWPTQVEQALGRATFDSPQSGPRRALSKLSGGV
ncbi:Hypothetical predicted protein [Lecanosticta acicola]|uniref:Uncharacterized protein n=1 Tax=Lecanosticta acicola TaxID=111012 RepID=A0AAI8Z3Q1_9PEZI|nr:Hypothetical predicted protein [Lecanosticta acicola]